jgi:hypothetical protein
MSIVTGNGLTLGANANTSKIWFIERRCPACGADWIQYIGNGTAGDEARRTVHAEESVARAWQILPTTSCNAY